MAIKLSDVSNTLQKVIMPYIRDNYPKQTILLDQVKRNKGVTFMNDYFYAPLRTGRHGGVGWLADDDNKLVSGKASFSQARVPNKILTGTFDISKLTIDATKTKKGAVANQLTYQAQSLSKDFAKLVNWQYFGDGSGALCQAAGSTSATEFPTELVDANGMGDDGRCKDRYGTINSDIAPLKYVQPNMIISIGSAGTAAHGTVSSGTSGTLFVTGAPCPIDQDIVYLVDGDGEGEGSGAVQGLGWALASDTGTSLYANVARSTDGWATQFGSTSEALTISRMENKYLAAREYAQAGDRYAIFVNKTLYQKYGDLLTSMRRAVNTADLLGGWTGLEFAAGGGRCGVFLDYDTPDGEVLIVNLDSLTICQVSDLKWLENASEGALVRKTDYITYQATMVWFTNLLCLCPAANAKLTRKTN